MALYDALKDAAQVVNKAQNADLYQMLLDAQRQALELQAENTELKKKIEEAQDLKALESRIIRHELGYFTLKDEPDNLLYCANCWGNSGKLIQIGAQSRAYMHRCHTCGYRVSLSSVK